jgi:pimeloyl-ACP methyl ester carboxylesterase
MPEYREEHIDVNGIDTAVFSAGEGEPLLFIHGGGTVTGFDSLLPLAERSRLIVPHTPGFGASADDAGVDSVHDYVLHYLDLLDALDLQEVSVVGHSLGGYIACMLAAVQGERFRRIVLVAPFGLLVREHPTIDLFSVPDEEILGVLANDMTVFEGHVSMPPTPEFLAERYRETTSLARIIWGRPYDTKLSKWLHRVTTPTLLLWGDQDRVVPVGQAPVWEELLPDAKLTVIPGVGHLVFDESREAVDAVAEFVAAGVNV